MEKEHAYGLVISPHPDDAEIGLGGTVARWVMDKGPVIYGVCTSGEKGTSDRSIQPEALAKTREREQLEAAKVLGVKDVVFLRYPDQGLEDTAEFRKDIVRLIRTYRPRVIATTDPYRRFPWHRDHRITGQIVLDAVFPYARDHLAYPDLLEMGLEPHKTRDIYLWGAEEPNLRVDITPTFDKKMMSLRCHKSQLQDADEWEQWMIERCESMAEGQDFQYAEALRHIKMPY